MQVKLSGLYWLYIQSISINLFIYHAYSKLLCCLIKMYGIKGEKSFRKFLETYSSKIGSKVSNKQNRITIFIRLKYILPCSSTSLSSSVLFLFGFRHVFVPKSFLSPQVSKNKKYTLFGIFLILITLPGIILYITRT